MPAPTTTVWTIGHSDHERSRFLDLLHAQGIEVVVDVRSKPSSRRVPWTARSALRDALAADGIGYVWLGELGGRPAGGEWYRADGTLDVERRRADPAFAEALERLLHVARGWRAAVMCAEEDPRRCHRRTLLTPLLEDHGLEVVHVRGDGRTVREAELAARDDASRPPRLL